MPLVRNVETGEITTDWNFLKSQLLLDIERIRLVDPILAGRMEMALVIDDKHQTFKFDGEAKDLEDLERAIEVFNQRFLSGGGNG